MIKFRIKKAMRVPIFVYAALQVLPVILSIIFTVSVFIFFNIDKQNIVLWFTVLLTWFVFHKLVQSLIVSGLTITLTDKSIEFIFPASFFLREKILLKNWTDVYSYLIQEEAYFTKFRLYTSSGATIKIYIEDDKSAEFTAFVNEFERKIDRIHTDASISFIKKNPNFYQTKFGLFLAILTACAMIVWPIVLLFSEKNINWGYILAFYPGAIFYLFKIYENRRR